MLNVIDLRQTQKETWIEFEMLLYLWRSSDDNFIKLTTLPLLDVGALLWYDPLSNLCFINCVIERQARLPVCFDPGEQTLVVTLIRIKWKLEDKKPIKISTFIVKAFPSWTDDDLVENP